MYVQRTPNMKLQISFTMAPVTRRKKRETAGGVERGEKGEGRSKLHKPHKINLHPFTLSNKLTATGNHHLIS